MKKAYQFRALLEDIDLARILREQDLSSDAVVAIPKEVVVWSHTGLHFFIAVRHAILRDAKRFGIPYCVDSFGTSPLARALGGQIGHASAAIGVEGWDIYYPSHPNPEDPRKAITQLVQAVRARRTELHTIEVFVV